MFKLRSDLQLEIWRTTKICVWVTSNSAGIRKEHLQYQVYSISVTLKCLTLMDCL
jgi:hypothetical protein